MNIAKNLNGKTLEVKLDGRLDTATAPALEAELANSLDGITELVFDFADLEYISSAGLRVLVRFRNELANKARVRIINANEIVQEVFEVTGLKNVLAVE